MTRVLGIGALVLALLDAPHGLELGLGVVALASALAAVPPQKKLHGPAVAPLRRTRIELPVRRTTRSLGRRGWEEAAPNARTPRVDTAVIFVRSSIVLAVLAAGCASGPRPITMSCRPLGDVHVEGAPLSAVVELQNESGGEVTILGSTVPWLYHHAVRLESAGTSDPLAVVDPGDVPELTIPAGGSDRGDVNVGRLRDAEGRSITEHAGAHRVVLRARLVLVPSQQEIDVSCELDVTIVPRDTELGRAYERAAQAAREEGIELDRFRSISAEREGAEWRFTFEHVYPAPPGGHFGVRIDASGAATVRHGE